VDKDKVAEWLASRVVASRGSDGFLFTVPVLVLLHVCVYKYRSKLKESLP
jgi:hypothetical protein